ncbi:MAG TPA: GerMN domain-containing protein [Acidimicrobiales bacterium]|nr:GerMN domain-containing protein [Acidimicrobiales bacterium]
MILRRLFLLGVGAATLAGCTLVPTAKAPVIISAKTVPFGLLGKTIPGTNNGRVRFITQPVYIVDATGHLTASSRIVPTPPTLASVLRELAIGPTDIEMSTGYTSALPSNLVILQAKVKKDIGYIALADPLSALPVRQQVLALGQLAMTASNVGATKGIEITVGGVAQPSLLPNGETATVITARDYQSLLNG